MKKNILILGATGQIARWVVDALGGDDDLQLTLVLRDPAKLAGVNVGNARLMVGDVLDRKLLAQAMAGQDVVYANLTGDDIDAQARGVISAMQIAGVKRLIFVLALGIYDEVPGKFGEWNTATIGEELVPFRRAADAIEASGLDYTVLRPAWLTDEDEVDYELTARDEPFKGTVISRRSVAEFISALIQQPAQYIGANLGMNKPGTDADKPYFM